MSLQPLVSLRVRYNLVFSLGGLLILLVLRLLVLLVFLIFFARPFFLLNFGLLFLLNLSLIFPFLRFLPFFVRLISSLFLLRLGLLFLSLLPFFLLLRLLWFLLALTIGLVKLIGPLPRGQGLQVAGHVVEALGLCEVVEDAGGALAVPVPADGAVAESPVGRAGPGGVHQRLLAVLAVPDLEAPSTELSPHPHALAAPADGLGVGGLLAALVAGGADRLVVRLVAEPLADLVEHRLGHVLGHQHVLVRVDLPRSRRTLLHPVLVGLVVVAVIAVLLLGQAPRLGVLVRHLAAELLPVLGLLGDPGGLPAPLHPHTGEPHLIPIGITLHPLPLFGRLPLSFLTDPRVLLEVREVSLQCCEHGLPLRDVAGPNLLVVTEGAGDDGGALAGLRRRSSLGGNRLLLGGSLLAETLLVVIRIAVRIKIILGFFLRRLVLLRFILFFRLLQIVKELFLLVSDLLLLLLL